MSETSPQILKFVGSVEPTGNKNGVNLIFAAPHKFVIETLNIFLSGLHLDIGRDFVVSGDNQTFTVVINPSDPTRLNVAPLQNEKFFLSYAKL